MMRFLVLAIVLGGACTSNNGPAITATVSCTGLTVKQGGVDEAFQPCTIDAGTCSDGNTPDTFMSCGCAIDDVSEDSQELQIADQTCPAASMITAKQVERAWLDCGIALTVTAM